MDLKDAFEARDAALIRVEENADPDWLQRAKEALHALAVERPEVHCDDLWSRVEIPRDGRAAGAVWSHGRRQGWIVNGGWGKPSVNSNGSSKPMWVSKLYQGPLVANVPVEVLRADMRRAVFGLASTLKRVPVSNRKQADLALIVTLGDRYGITADEITQAIKAPDVVGSATPAEID